MSFLSPARETRQEIPPHRLHLIQQSFRRRLSDHIEDVLYRACTEDDTVTAEALYGVLESLQVRREQLYGRERRISSDDLVRAATALEECRRRNQKLEKAA